MHVKNAPILSQVHDREGVGAGGVYGRIYCFAIGEHPEHYPLTTLLARAGIYGIFRCSA